MKKVLVRALVSVLFLALFYHQTKEDMPEIVRVLRSLDLGLAVFSAAAFLFTILVLAKRFQLILEAEEVRMNLAESARLTLVGYFFNNFLPTSVGGDIVKALCAAQTTGKPVKCVTSVLIDRLLGLFTFVLIPSVSFLFAWKLIQNPQIPAIIYSLLVLCVAFSFLLFHGGVARKMGFAGQLLERFRWGEKIRRIAEGLHHFRRRRRVVAQAAALSFVGQMVNIGVLYLMALALGVRAEPLYFFLLIPIVHLISLFPSLNGLGPREWAYVYFLSPWIGKEYAAAVSVLWLALLLLASAAGGLIYLVRHEYHIRLSQAAS